MSFTIGQVSVKQDPDTDKQCDWCDRWHGKYPAINLDQFAYNPISINEQLYLCLAAESFNRKKALKRLREQGISDKAAADKQINEEDATAAQIAIGLLGTKAVSLLSWNSDDTKPPPEHVNGITSVIRPSFVGADFVSNRKTKRLLEAAVRRSPTCLHEAKLVGAKLVGADLQGVDLQRANLHEANLRMANLRMADLRMADLWRADLRLTDLSGADLRYLGEKRAIKWDLAFYNADEPPNGLLNLPDNIKDNLLALDKKSYEKAKKLQAAYREALEKNDSKAMTAAEKALTKHLEKCREDNAKKALQSGVSLDGDYSLSAQAKASIEVSNPLSPDNPYNDYHSR
jgi:uncharacterized protein YjbI with pentapeptide repeats